MSQRLTLQTAVVSSTPTPQTAAIEQTLVGESPQSVSTLEKSNEGQIAAAIPAIVIQNICEELDGSLSEEHQPGATFASSIALRKHSKNCGVQTVSQVCRSWRSHATAFMCLWRDIAFDVAEPKSIRLAASFLSLVRDQEVLLRIYAGFGCNDLPDPNIKMLLCDLRDYTSRWVVFEYQGTLGEYHSFLDLPASNLRYFRDYGDPTRNSFRFFSGWVPSLYSLSASSTTPWTSAMLSNLTEFQFRQSTCGPSPSLNSLLNFFRSAPGLETLRFESLGSFVHDCAADTSSSLLHLHTLHVYNTDFSAVAEHLFIPNVRKASFAIDTPTHPAFGASHALAGLLWISILDQPTSEVMVVVAHKANEGTFRIRLTTIGGSSLDICLVWDAGILQHWKSYTTGTLSALTERIQLDPSAMLRLYLGIRPSRKQASQGAYKIHGGFARRFFRMLAGAGIPPVISPPIARHLLIINDTLILDEDETQMFRLFLRSRATCKAGIFIRIRHESSPWLNTEDSECLDECSSPHDFLEIEFHPLGV